MDFREIIGDAIIAESIYEEIKDTVKEAATKLADKVGVSRDDALIQGAISLTVQRIHAALESDDDEDESENAPDSHDCCHCDSKPETSNEDDARTALAKVLGLI